jgi:hypothetical protein
MSLIINTFLDKDNTIHSNSTTNLGRNPITELFYGGNFSRYLLHFDTERLKSLYNDGSISDLTNLTHKVKLFNCGAIESELINGEVNGRIRAVSFDLEIYPLEQHFDEGVGYDFNTDNYVLGDRLISSDASNWFKANTLSAWTSYGATNLTGTTALDSYHFDYGNENPEFDITPYVNSIITGNTDNNYGLVIQFKPDYENTISDIEQYIGFFSRHTHTFFEPYLQTTYNHTIKDDRNKFYLDKTNKLYLYSNIGGQSRDLDNIPTCTIQDSAGATILSPTVIKAGKGVYYVEIIFNNTTHNSTNMFYDVWSNLNYNGNPLSDVELEFTTRRPEVYFNIGDESETPREYNISLSGIKPSEDIIKGDMRKVMVGVRIPFTANQSAVIDGLYYRLYVKEGLGETTVVDYIEINRTFNNNFFLIDTLGLVSHKYYIDIKLAANDNVKHFKDILSFNIANQTESRHI